MDILGKKSPEKEAAAFRFALGQMEKDRARAAKSIIQIMKLVRPYGDFQSNEARLLANRIDYQIGEICSRLGLSIERDDDTNTLKLVDPSGVVVARWGQSEKVE